MGRVLRLGDLKEEDGNSDNNEGEKEKGGTTMTERTANVQTWLGLAAAVRR